MLNVKERTKQKWEETCASDLQRQICEAQDFDEHLQERKRLLEQGND